jgi:hypothetical protein
VNEETKNFTSEERAVFYQKMYQRECQKTKDLERFIGRFVAWIYSLVETATINFEATNEQVKKEFEALSKALRSKAN